MGKQDLFSANFKDSKVVVTGHTGFKGGWLVRWLHELGAKVFGLSDREFANPCFFNAVDVSDCLQQDFRVNVCDLNDLKRCISSVQPDYVFHLAAQSIVSRAFSDPITTYTTNALGSVSLLEATRQLSSPTVVVMVTSDKVYENVEWEWGYRETDRLGGGDPYSASKAMAELAISAHFRSFIKSESHLKVGIGRAGNVVGGGDWAPSRIVPDAMRCWANNEMLTLRNPNSTRPWQHVLEPLGAYLLLACWLNENPKSNELYPFNFGPQSEQNATVLDLVKLMNRSWPSGKFEVMGNNQERRESGLLKLNCDRALDVLGWRSQLDIEECLQSTVHWYKAFYERSESIQAITQQQISSYQNRLLEALG